MNTINITLRGTPYMVYASVARRFDLEEGDVVTDIKKSVEIRKANLKAGRRAFKLFTGFMNYLSYIKNDQN